MDESPRIKYIAVDGPIGAGKTTLAKLLASNMHATTLLEPTQKNPFLSDFYTNKSKNAFKTQLFFLLNRYQQQLELKNNEPSRLTISDYTFAKDAIFATVNLTSDELQLYNTIFSLLKEKLPTPDLVIYLRAEPKVMKERIYKRGIDYERHIDATYLEKLTESYNRYFLDYDDSPLLVVDSSNQNYTENPSDFENLKRAISNHRGGTVHLIARS